MRWVNLFLRLILGGIFVASAVAKISNVQIAHYHVTQFSYAPDLKSSPRM